MNYEEGIEKIINGLKEYDKYISHEYIAEFDLKSSGMREKIEESLKEGRLLKIGIVGEVKVGKSSFLNSLIFDGKDILPKASTPMTAALTRIHYSKNDTAKIVFYSKKDWENVRRCADEYDKIMDNMYEAYIKEIQDEKDLYANSPHIIKELSKEEYRIEHNEKISLVYRSCKELLDLYEKSSINLEDYLETELDIDCSNFEDELDDYIGANGRYTSIVKHVEIGMNNELLEGIEIIDTPGMNDPIVSRGETTKKFLQNCDVVFLLSYCGQFLTQEDIMFMNETLPREGVKNVVIIGSKLDSGVLDNSQTKEFKKALAQSKNTYNKQAEKNINKCLSSGRNTDAILKIKESLPPLYVSPLLYDVAKKNKEGLELKDYEIQIIKQFKNRFSDFSDDEKTLLKVSGIIKVRQEKLKEIKEQKEQIINEKNKSIVEDSRKILMGIISNINSQIRSDYMKVKNGDIEKLENDLNVMQKNLERLRNSLKNVFEKYKLEALRIQNRIGSELELEMNNHKDFPIKESSHIEYHVLKTGIFKKEVHQENVVTKSASVADVISNMNSYIARCKVITNDTFNKVINVNKLKKDVKDVVLSSFEETNQEFNENDILIPLDLVVGKVSIPDISIDSDSFEDIIVNSFSSATAYGDEIDALRLSQNRVLSQISKRINAEIERCRSNTELIMDEQSVVFVDNINNTLNNNLQRIKDKIENREESIKDYEELIKNLTEYTSIIMSLEM